MNNICLILEDCTVARNRDMYVLHEEKINYQDRPANKVIFRTKLQTAEEVNGNNRYYPKSICMEIVNSLQGKAKGRNLLQEIDHPFTNASSSDDSFKRRAAVVEIKNCGSLIRNIYMEGRDIIAEVETLSGFKGPDLASLIRDDKADIGFSWRGFANIKPRSSTGGNVMEVSLPLRPITYDVVSNPSHSSARVLSFLSENTSVDNSVRELLTQESEEILLESADSLLFESEHYCIPGSSKEECSKYMKSLLQEHFNLLKPFSFKI